MLRGRSPRMTNDGHVTIVVVVPRFRQGTIWGYGCGVMISQSNNYRPLVFGETVRMDAVRPNKTKTLYHFGTTFAYAGARALLYLWGMGYG